MSALGAGTKSGTTNGERERGTRPREPSSVFDGLYAGGLQRPHEPCVRAVFVDWLVCRRPAAREAASGPGDAGERLLRVCRLMALEPWAEMVEAPMGSKFFEICERIDPESEALYRKLMLECVTIILGDEVSAEVFLLALDGLFADQPSMDVLEPRTRLLVARFAPPAKRKKEGRTDMRRLPWHEPF